jgi:hypothetical protein
MDEIKEPISKSQALKEQVLKEQNTVKIVNEVASISLNPDETVSITITKEQFAEFIKDSVDDNLVAHVCFAKASCSLLDVEPMCKLRDVEPICRILDVEPICRILQAFECTDKYLRCGIYPLDKCHGFGRFDPGDIISFIDKGILKESVLNKAQLERIKLIRDTVIVNK